MNQETHDAPGPEKLGDDLFTATFLKAVALSANLPVCPLCGECWKDVTAPTLGKTIRVRFACEHVLNARETMRSNAQKVQDFQDRRRRWPRLGPPAGFGELLLGNIRRREGVNLEGLRVARRYLDTWPQRAIRGEGVLMAGGFGTNKTMIAIAIANELETRFCTTAFLTGIDLVERLKDWDNAPALYDCLVGADLLVLDEFGIGKITEWAASKLFQVIDTRYANAKPIVVTTNLDGAETLEHFTRCLTSGRDAMSIQEAAVTVGRIQSRLRERSAVVRFPEGDHREASASEWLLEPKEGNT